MAKSHTHKCAVGSCEIDIALSMLMCAAHWRMVPKAKQDRVWKAWRMRGRGDGYVREHYNACLDAKRTVEAELAQRAERETQRTFNLGD